MRWTVGWSQYCAGLLASLPIALLAFAPEDTGWYWAAFPLLTLAGAIAGSFFRRQQFTRQNRTVVAKTGWCIIQAMTWSFALVLNSFAMISAQLGNAPTNALSLLVFGLLMNVMFIWPLGLLSAGLQFGIWRSQLGPRQRWFGFVSLSWFLAGFLVSLLWATGNLIEGAGRGVWLSMVLLGLPPIWAMQTAIVDFALPAERSTIAASGE